MKKITAVISAAAMAAAMLVPVTAGAATIVSEDFSEDHSTMWTPSTYFTNVSDGRYDLAISNLSKTINWGDTYTLKFDVAMGSTTPDGFCVRLQQDASNYVNIVDVYRAAASTNNAAVRAGGGRTAGTTVSPTSSTGIESGGTQRSQLWMIANQTYTITIEVDGKTATVDIDGTFNYSAADFNKQTVVIPEEITPETLIFTDTSGTGKTNLYLDNISITTPDESEITKATAQTREAGVTGTFEYGGTTFTPNEGAIIVNGVTSKFYETEITANDQTVDGGTITVSAEGKTAVPLEFTTTVQPDDVGYVYTVISTDGEWAVPTFDVTLNVD